MPEAVSYSPFDGVGCIEGAFGPAAWHPIPAVVVMVTASVTPETNSAFNGGSFPVTLPPRS